MTYKKKQLLTIAAGLLLLSSGVATAQSFPLEKLDRGMIGIKTSSGVYLSWRLLGTDDAKVQFDLYRDGELVNTDAHLTDVTNYTDKNGTTESVYTLKTLDAEGNEIESTNLSEIWATQYKRIALDVPEPLASDGDYDPNDISVGDVDGDGEYEIFLKWNPKNSADNSQKWATSNVYIDCIKLDGTKLWRIDLGPNIRAGAHYTQFLVYDFDGDGKAELACKTAPGSVDGAGKYVSEAATDETIKSADNTAKYANSNGIIIAGPEYYTVFNGLTGAAIHTTNYLPARTITSSWGDTYGNRCERYLAAAAYIKGVDGNVRPCMINSRGYYTQAYVWAAQFDGSKIETVWLHKSESLGTAYKVVDASGNETSYTANANTSGVQKSNSTGGVAGSGNLYGNGNHNLSIADVDGDGLDEIIWGAAALDDDGKVLYSTGMGHGDAIHLADLDPTRPGLEVFDVHEEKLSLPYGAWDVHDAATGEILYMGGPAGVDNGRGIAAQLDANHYGFYFYSNQDKITRSCVSGEQVSAKTSSQNFRIYWDGDLQDELLDGTNAKADNERTQFKISKYNSSAGTYSDIATFNGWMCNTTKSTPCFMGDILGDWREEVIVRDSVSPTDKGLLIYTTVTPSKYRVTTLPHDHTYRMGMVWEQTAYNQPPHLGYYLPDLFEVTAYLRTATGSQTSQTVEVGDVISSIELEMVNCSEVTVSGLSEGLTYTVADGKVTISGTPINTCSWKVTPSGLASGDKSIAKTGTITVNKRLATLTLTSGAQNLNIDPNVEITPIVFTTTNVTDVEVSGLPEGISYTFEDGQITISGKTEEDGVFAYTITASGDPKTVEGTSLTGVISTAQLSLIAHFAFDESLLNEVTATEATATDLTTEYVYGMHGKALSMTGSGASRVAMSHYDKFTLSTISFTIGLWIKSTMPQEGAYIFHSGSTTKNTSTGASGKWVGIEYKSGKLYFAIDDDVTKTQAAITDATGLFDGEWHSIVGVRDVVNKKLYIYTDGKLATSADDKTGDISQTEEIVIGNATVSYDRPYTGLIDDLKVYSGAMSAEEVKEEYTPSVAAPLSNIVASNGEIRLLSNIVSDNIYLCIDGGANVVDACVYDLTGKVVVKQNYGNALQTIVRVSANGMNKGLYILRVRTQNDVKEWKVVKR